MDWKITVHFPERTEIYPFAIMSRETVGVNPPSTAIDIVGFFPGGNMTRT
jgi:hypothetical protein